MRLKELIKDIDIPFQIIGDLNLDITGLTKDSRIVKKGFLFFFNRGKYIFYKGCL